MHRLQISAGVVLLPVPSPEQTDGAVILHVHCHGCICMRARSMNGSDVQATYSSYRSFSIWQIKAICILHRMLRMFGVSWGGWLPALSSAASSAYPYVCIARGNEVVHTCMSMQDLQQASVHQNAMLASMQARMDRMDEQLQALEGRRLQRSTSAWALLGR